MTPEQEYAEFSHAAGGADYQSHYDQGWHRSALISSEATIGDRTVIFSGVYIGPRVVIGNGCVIGPGACIGQPGFGYEEQADGSWQYKTHTAGVAIGDHVHVGANAVIDGGRHRATTIGDGTKIDAQTFLAHNVIVGRNCLIIAHAMIAGSCDIDDDVIISPGAQLRDHVRVGRRAMVGLGAVVTKNVPPGEIWVGTPAKFLRMRGAELR